MKNLIPMNLQPKICERPNFLSLTRSGKKYDELAKTLELIDVSKAITYDINEIEKEFGKNFKCCIRAALVKRNLHKIRIVVDDGRVYIWQTRV
jgi:DNA-binding MarR family transcriptional regulator